MLDDRSQNVSASQFVRSGVWDRISNETGWTAYHLLHRRGQRLAAQRLNHVRRDRRRLLLVNHRERGL